MNQIFRPLNIKFQSNFIVGCITKGELLSMIMTISAVDSQIELFLHLTKKLKENYTTVDLKEIKTY